MCSSEIRIGIGLDHRGCISERRKPTNGKRTRSSFIKILLCIMRYGFFFVLKSQTSSSYMLSRLEEGDIFVGEAKEGKLIYWIITRLSPDLTGREFSKFPLRYWFQHPSSLTLLPLSFIIFAADKLFFLSIMKFARIHFSNHKGKYTSFLLYFSFGNLNYRDSLFILFLYLIMFCNSGVRGGKKSRT